MNLYQKIITIYPELASINTGSSFWWTTIIMQDDSDGNGPYIKEWYYEKPQPTQEQLDALEDIEYTG